MIATDFEVTRQVAYGKYFLHALYRNAVLCKTYVEIQLVRIKYIVFFFCEYYNVNILWLYPVITVHT